MNITPLFGWLKDINSDTLRQDSMAALTIAFVALPQVMAYALIAGVQPQYGLYAFIVATIVGTLFGSSRHLQTGPTNATSIVVGSSLAMFVNHDNFMGIVFLLGMLGGILQLSAGLLKMGNLSQFISRSVLVGFIAGAGLLIIVNQLPNLMGIPKRTSRSILDGIEHVFLNLDQVHLTTLALGAATILIILVINKISPKSSSGIPLLPSYLLALIIASAAVAVLGLEKQGVAVVGDIRGSLPPLSLPVLKWSAIQSLTPGAIAIALIGFAEATSAAKTAASFAGDKIDADREFIGQGLAKIAASFFSGMPVSGSPTRTMLCYRAGAVTKFANIFAGVLLALIVLFLGPLASSIPLATLAGIVMIIAGSMVDWHFARLAIRSTRADALAMFATFIAALFFPLDTAIYIGVGLSLALFLRTARIPHVIELNYNEELGFEEIPDAKKPSIPELAIVHVEGEVFFGAVDALEEEIQKIARREEVKVLILRMKRTFCLDATAIMTLRKIHDDLEKKGKLMLISGATEEIERIFRDSGLDQIIGEENIYYSEPTLFQSTREALEHAVEHINTHYGKNYKIEHPDIL